MHGLAEIWRDWRDRAAVLRVLRKDQADTREWEYFRFKDAMTEAIDAIGRNDRARAEELWLAAIERYPDKAQGSAEALTVLLGLRRFDEAEALMQAGRRKSPGSQRFAIGLAEVPRARGDFAQAAQRWAVVRKRFPSVMLAYGAGVEALRGLNRLAEAEDLTKQMMARFPREVVGFMEYARLADQQQDWEQSMLRWDVVRTRFEHLSGYIGVARGMIRNGRLDEAEALLQSAVVRYPIEAILRIELAMVAENKGDMQEAVVRWSRIADRFPLDANPVFTAASALERLGANDEVERVLREAVDHFPAEPRPLVELGRLLLRQANPGSAAEVFATLRQTFPDDQAGYLGGAEALDLGGRSAEAAALRQEHQARFK